MPISLADFFEDEAYAHSVAVEERTDDVTCALKVGTIMPELEMSRAMGQSPISVPTFMSFNINCASKLILATTVAVLAVIVAWLVGQRDRVQIHATNFTSGLTVMVKNGGPTDQVLTLCVDSGATSVCISSARMGLIRVTSSRPRAKVKVASGTVLPVVAIGDLTLSDLSGFVLA